MDDLQGKVEHGDKSPATTTFDSTMPAPLGTQIGSYTLVQVLGKGGFGFVYLAEQTEAPHRKVAVKIIKVGMDTKESIARLKAEIQSLARMEHTNIVQVFKASTMDTGPPYIVMEWVDGPTITSYCDQEHLSIPSRLELFIQLCSGVQHAHHQGYAHRDLKPTNVLVAVLDGKPVPKIIDFGIAKAMGRPLTEQTLRTEPWRLLGTPEYMSPEQAEIGGPEVDSRTDVYSLGVMLYEILTGALPFNESVRRQEGYDRFLQILRDEDPPLPSTRLTAFEEELADVAKCRDTEPEHLRRLVRGDLDWIVMKALEKDRDRRYQSPALLAEDMQNYLDDRPISAHPPSARYRLAKFAKRHPGSVVAMATIVVMPIISFVTYVLSIQTEQKNTEAALSVATREQSRAERAQAEAVLAQRQAESETTRARQAAAQADARYYLQQSMLPAALERALEAYSLRGHWEDGHLLHQIAADSRQNWVLMCRIPSSSPASCGVFAAIDGTTYVVMIQPGQISCYDAVTGDVVASRPLRERVEFVALDKGPENVLVAHSNDSVHLFQLPLLTPLVTRTFMSPIRLMDANTTQLLLSHADGSVRICSLSDLTDVARTNWSDLSKGRWPETTPQHLWISPTGRYAILHSGPWHREAVIWDGPGRGDEAIFQSMRMSELAFADDSRVVTWFTPSGSGDRGDQLSIYSVGLGIVASQWVPGDDTKGRDTLEAWIVDDHYVYAGLVGRVGCLHTLIGPGTKVYSDQYGNLWPFAADRPALLCAGMRHGSLAVQTSEEVLVFKMRQQPATVRQIDDFCIAHSGAGMLTITPTVQLELTPFDIRQPVRTFGLQWVEGDRWLPWSLCSSSDGRTVVVMAQETEGLNRVGDAFGRTVALVYASDGIDTWVDSLPVTGRHVLEVPPPPSPWTQRFTVISPDQRTFLYWRSDLQTATRYDLETGQKLSSLVLGPAAARSADGKWVAGIHPSQSSVTVYDVETGAALESIECDSGIRGLCFTSDGRHLFVGRTGGIDRYEVNSGRHCGEIATELIPMAAQSDGNRFVAFQSDITGSAGSIVLADSETGQPVTVLSRGGAADHTAVFSPSEGELILLNSRWEAKMFRSLTPEQALEALRTPAVAAPFPGHDLAPIPAPAISAEAAGPAGLPLLQAADIKSLRSHVGSTVTVEGAVVKLSWTRSRNALNLEFVGTGNASLLGWIPPSALTRFNAAFNGDFAAAVEGKVVRIHGYLALYGGKIPSWADRPQIILEKPEQLEILAD